MHHENHNHLVAHFFRNQYGKMLAVVAKYVGLEEAEDIVQDTLMTATEHWKLNGTPPNPEAWLYKTARNKTLNVLRKRSVERQYQQQPVQNDRAEIEFSDEAIADDLLRMMLTCCHPMLSSEITITLILKTLCGFSVAEIAAAFCTNTELISKRLFRGRKRLKAHFPSAVNPADLNQHIATLLEAIYLLFNEGYLPARKDQATRKDLCLEAIRLAEIIVGNRQVSEPENAHALLALMYLNCARFDARTGQDGEMVEIAHQDRVLWGQNLINKGLHHLNQAQQKQQLSKYLILASISGNHCIARTYQETNWKEILSLYDALLTLEDNSIIRLNRIVALWKAQGASVAILELQNLQGLGNHHLYHSVLAQLNLALAETEAAIACYKKAMALSPNPRVTKFLAKKLTALVPNPNAQVY